MAVRRVAMVLNSPGLGGVPEVVRALSTRLPADRYEPHIFLLKPGEAAGMAAFTDLGFEPTVADPAGGKMSVIAQLAGWLSDRRIDILHTHSFRPNLYGSLDAAGPGCGTADPVQPRRRTRCGLRALLEPASFGRTVAAGQS
jgi:hypothetical protein